MKIKEYIERIKYKGELAADLNILKKLQEVHLLTIPFENLDIHYGKPIDLDVDEFYKKIVQNNRGGFCYELNGLFYALLKAIGYNVKMISARVYNSTKKEFGLEYDHLAIVAELNKVEYLVDVGFGEFAFNPLKIELNTIQSDSRGNFIIEEYNNKYYIVSKIKDEVKTPEYIFKNEARELSDFKEMSLHNQTSPNSHFTKKKLISKPTNNGRITITGNTLKITEAGKTITEKAFKENEFNDYLKKWFNMHIN